MNLSPGAKIEAVCARGREVFIGSRPKPSIGDLLKIESPPPTKASCYLKPSVPRLGTVLGYVYTGGC